jgi:hypothetical protein
MKAGLYLNKRGDRYSVLFHGEIVEHSRDPECDAGGRAGRGQ